jgi:23S rRNA pseudouridine1911/1915/1917 synthase
MPDGPPQRFTVTPEEAGERLDRFLAGRCPGLSRSQIQRLNALDGVSVDGRRRADSYAVAAGESVAITPEMLTPSGLAGGTPGAEAIPVAVVYEDDEVAVANKPAGMVTHPAHGNWTGTLVNALLGRGTPLSALGAPERPGVVHRLDKDTSGLVVLGKTDRAYRALAEEIKRHEFEKVYHAIAVGHLPSRELRVEAPIGRHPVHRQRMTVLASGGRAAGTDVLVVDRYGQFDYIRLATRTGRTHQIRVHLAHVGHPLLGDPVYGGRRRKGQAPPARSKDVFAKLLRILPRHALHASRLSFTHPVTGERMTFTAALPDDMRTALETIHREDRFEGGSA